MTFSGHSFFVFCGRKIMGEVGGFRKIVGDFRGDVRGGGKV